MVLNKNSESAFGKWELHVEDGDRVSLRCSCTALVAGLDAQYFKLICEQLLTQVAAVEKRFHGYGLM